MDIERRLAEKISGEITLSDTPGEVMKRWRERVGATQVEVAKEMEVSPSVICDYESGRRRSPGVYTVKKFVDAIVKVDKERGGGLLRAYEKLLSSDLYSDAILDMREFNKPVKIKKFAEVIKCTILTNKDMAEKQIYGYTIIDSLKAILEIPAQEYVRIYGLTTERALIFTNVHTGRSPMVAVRVTPLKPRVLVFHGLSEYRVDKLALKLSDIEKIPILISEVRTVEEMIEMLRDINYYY